MKSNKSLIISKIMKISLIIASTLSLIMCDNSGEGTAQSKEYRLSEFSK